MIGLFCLYDRSEDHALTAAHKVDEILAECSQRLRKNDGRYQDSETALSQLWLSDIVRYLREHGGSQGVMMTSMEEKVPRPVGLKVELGKLLVSEEAVRAGVSVMEKFEMDTFTVGERGYGDSKHYRCPKCLAKFSKWTGILSHLSETRHVAPSGLNVKLGRLLVLEEAVRAGVSVTGTSPSTVVSLREPQHEPQRILMEILRISGGEMLASDLFQVISAI
jgi:hypothetical protein